MREPGAQSCVIPDPEKARGHATYDVMKPSWSKVDLNFGSVVV